LIEGTAKRGGGGPRTAEEKDTWGLAMWRRRAGEGGNKKKKGGPISRARELGGVV